jgi:hypothetical protein
MNPKEKAKELFDKFSNVPLLDSYEAKQCALVAVDEIILEMDNVMLPNPFKQYWNEIKQEIEKL